MDFQRLFSRFAAGWPGVGLLLLRLLAAITPVHFCTCYAMEAPRLAFNILYLMGAGARILLPVDLWAPILGIVVAIIEIPTILFPAGDPWISFILAMLCVTLGMFGPAAWSSDARLFGRKRLRKLNNLSPPF